LFNLEKDKREAVRVTRFFCVLSFFEFSLLCLCLSHCLSFCPSLCLSLSSAAGRETDSLSFSLQLKKKSKELFESWKADNAELQKTLDKTQAMVKVLEGQTSKDKTNLALLKAKYEVAEVMVKTKTIEANEVCFLAFASPSLTQSLSRARALSLSHMVSHPASLSLMVSHPVSLSLSRMVSLSLSLYLSPRGLNLGFPFFKGFCDLPGAV